MNIVIIGAGNGGENIIQSFSKIEDINITNVIDKNLEAPGIILAKKLGINYSTSIEDVDVENTDLILEVTGKDIVKDMLCERCGDRCKIINSQGALLIMTLVQKDIERMEKLNNQVEVIGKTTEVVQQRLKDIFEYNTDMNEVTNILFDFAKVSDKYIEQINKIIQYVSRIAHQSKILGINATIEAGRAGENGKAFTIVAKEIQGLANDSEEKSKGIEQILSKLSKGIKEVNESVSNLKRLSNIQVEALDNMGNYINELSSQVEK